MALQTTGPARTSCTEGLTQYDKHDLLSSRRRHIILDTLYELGGETDLGTLVDLAKDCIERREDESEREHRHRVYINFYQVHLAKLDELDVVILDDSTTPPTIEQGPNFGDLLKLKASTKVPLKTPSNSGGDSR